MLNGTALRGCFTPAVQRRLRVAQRKQKSLRSRAARRAHPGLAADSAGVRLSTTADPSQHIRAMSKRQASEVDLDANPSASKAVKTEAAGSAGEVGDHRYHIAHTQMRHRTSCSPPWRAATEYYVLYWRPGLPPHSLPACGGLNSCNARWPPPLPSSYWSAFLAQSFMLPWMPPFRCAPHLR